MMESHLVLWIAFCVLVSNEISLVQTPDQCKTHADCAGKLFHKFCCAGGDIFNRTRLTCDVKDCEGKYCETESHYGDSTMCCYSNKCVDRGCFGCASNSDCSSGHVCCKKSFPKAQTVCAEKCVGLECNHNDGCAGTRECCRDNKCVGGLLSFNCFAQCKSNSECHLGKYCCKKKWVWFWQNRCSETCGGDCGPPYECCSSVDDCSGLPNECCIAGKCTKDGCPECKSDSNYTLGLYCCMKRYTNEASECLADCIGESCGTTDDCGGPDEICNSSYRCAERETGPNPNPDKSSPSPSLDESSPSPTPKKESGSAPNDESPMWRHPVIVIVGLLAVIGVSIAVYWYYRRKRPSTPIQINRKSLENTQNQGTAITNPKTQFTGLNNPTQQQGTAFALHPCTDRHQQDTIDNERYVISPINQIFESPDVGQTSQRTAAPRLYPPKAFNLYNPPPYPGNHPDIH